MFPILRRQSPSRKFKPLICPLCGGVQFECDELLPDTYYELMRLEVRCPRCGWEGPFRAVVEETDVQTPRNQS